jgi:hypothetical protein
MPKFIATVSALATMTGRFEVEAPTPAEAATIAKSKVKIGDYDPDWELVDRGRPVPGSAAVDSIRDENDEDDILTADDHATRSEKAEAALAKLIEARDLFKSAGASARLLDKIRLAISSGKGAVRHAENKDMADYADSKKRPTANSSWSPRADL